MCKAAKVRKHDGPDGLTAEHLNYEHPALTVHLKLFICLMLSYGLVPEAFGFGLIAPLVKDKLGDHNKVENYIGITLTPVISKIFESVILQLTENKLQTGDLQFGF